jgi:hypothetical protein
MVATPLRQYRADINLKTKVMSNENANNANVLLPAGFGHIMKFGKHKGKSLAQILDEDYGYVIWLSEENVLSIDEKVTGMAYNLQNEDDDNYSWADWHDMF